VKYSAGTVFIHDNTENGMEDRIANIVVTLTILSALYMAIVTL
jgi:hypothetical protein